MNILSICSESAPLPTPLVNLNSTVMVKEALYPNKPGEDLCIATY